MFSNKIGRIHKVDTHMHVSENATYQAQILLTNQNVLNDITITNVL